MRSGGDRKAYFVVLRSSSRLLVWTVTVVNLAIAMIWILSGDTAFAVWFALLATLCVLNLRYACKVDDRHVYVRNAFRSYKIECSEITGHQAQVRFHIGISLVPWSWHPRRRDWYLAVSNKEAVRVAVFSEFRGLLDGQWRSIGTESMTEWFEAKGDQRSEA